MAEGLKKLFMTDTGDHFDFDAEGVGTLRIEGNVIYKWVKNVTPLTESVAPSVGAIANYLPGADDNTVSGSWTQLGRAAPAGVYMWSSTVSQGEPYGWLQLTGSCIVRAYTSWLGTYSGTIDTTGTEGVGGYRLYPLTSGDVEKPNICMRLGISTYTLASGSGVKVVLNFPI